MLRALLFICALLLAHAAHAHPPDADVPAIAKKLVQGHADALDELKRLAEQEHAEAQHYLGNLYLTGRGLPQSERLALEWFRRAARNGDLPSIHNVGVLYERALDTELRNADLAMAWYRFAAERGFPRSQANLGQMLGDGEEAQAWIEKAAQAGDPRGQYLLGMFHIRKRDDARGAELVRQAAEGGDRDAQHLLALLYRSGKGREKNEERAAYWLRRAAEQEHAEAQFLLAALHTRGLYGVERDDAKAAEWLRRSAKQGHAEAAYALGTAYAEGRGVRQDMQEALGWMILAANHKHPLASAIVERIKTRNAEAR